MDGRACLYCRGEEILNGTAGRASQVMSVNEPLTPKMKAVPLLPPVSASVLGVGLLLSALSSCASSGKVKDEGSYTTTGKTAAESSDKKASVGGSVGVYTGTAQ